MKVIVNFPRQIGGKIYKKSKAPQMIPNKHMEHPYNQALLECGDLSTVYSKKDDEDEAPKKKKKKIVE